jgi:hypothetical protein
LNEKLLKFCSKLKKKWGVKEQKKKKMSREQVILALKRQGFDLPWDSFSTGDLESLGHIGVVTTPAQASPRGSNFLQVHQVPGDGDCFYHSFCFALRHGPEELQLPLITAVTLTLQNLNIPEFAVGKTRTYREIVARVIGSPNVPVGRKMRQAMQSLLELGALELSQDTQYIYESLNERGEIDIRLLYDNLIKSTVYADEFALKALICTLQVRLIVVTRNKNAYIPAFRSCEIDNRQVTMIFHLEGLHYQPYYVLRDGKMHALFMHDEADELVAASGFTLNRST